MDKLIINCAITGSRISREQTPYIPVTPKEIIDSAVGAAEAGAAVVHIHVRDKKTGLGVQDLGIFKEVTEGIKARSNVIQCLTTSGIPGKNLPDDERLIAFALKPELGSIDCGSINIGNLLFINRPEFVERAMKEMYEKKIKPEMEVFELGMIELCKKLIGQNLLRKPYYFGFILGSPTGAQANIQTLLTMVDHLPPDGVWFAAGIGKSQLAINSMAILLGGHVRTGLEDNIYYSAGVLAKSNAELVAKLVRIAWEVGREVATPDEARKILGLK